MDLSIRVYILVEFWVPSQTKHKMMYNMAFKVYSFREDLIKDHQRIYIYNNESLYVKQWEQYVSRVWFTIYFLWSSCFYVDHGFSLLTYWKWGSDSGTRFTSLCRHVIPKPQLGSARYRVTHNWFVLQFFLQ